MRAWRCVSVFPMIAFIAGCASDLATFGTAFAGDRTSVPNASLSVVGVYRDGRMSPGTWAEIGPKLFAPLHLTDCDAGFSLQLERDDPDGAAAIDHAARTIGVNDQVLEQMAPAATGDVLFVVRISGKLPAPPRDQVNAPGSGVMTRGTRQNPRSPVPDIEPDGERLEITGSLYSVAERRTIAAVTLSYGGDSVDDALRRLGERLATIAPAARCGGWNKTVRLDAERIRKLN